MGDWRRTAGLLWDALRRDRPGTAALAVGLDVVVAGGGSALAGLWLKLIVDGAVSGDASTVLWAALILAASVGVVTVLSLQTARLYQDLHESSALVLMHDLMALTAGVPGIEHHERPDHADRIALVRERSRVLTDFVATAGRGWPWWSASG